jgi:hypothetical protein
VSQTPTYSSPVQLEQPIVRGEQTISEICIRKPGAGELRGLKLTDLLQMDVTALTTVLPRVTSPTLTSADVSAMDPVDLLALGGEVVGFFLSKSERGVLSPTT